MKGPVSEATSVAITWAGEEAALRGDRRIGTDHLLLGLLRDPLVQETLGTDVELARAAAHELDRTALATLGVNLDSLPQPAMPPVPGHLPLTSGTRAAIARGLEIAHAEHVRKAEPRHLLAALLERRPPDPGAVLLESIRP